MTRQERVARRLDAAVVAGAVQPGWYRAHGRWLITPAGFSERSLTTPQLEDFLLGVEAALSVARRAPLP